MRKVDPLKLFLLPLIPALGFGIVEVAQRIDLGFTDTTEPAVAVAPTVAPPLLPLLPCIDCGTDA